jgi:CoA:oxalate CoA-transferase
MIVEIDDPVIGRLFVAGNPVKLDGVPEPEARRPPPALDADRAAILRWLGRD